VNVSLATGHDWKIGRLLVGPTIEGRYNYIGINHFSESGADSLDLNVNHQSANSLESLVGARASYVWQVTPTRAVIPYLSVQWLHEYMDGARSIDASLLGEDFSAQTTAIGADGLLINAGLTINWTDRVSSNIGYQGELGRADYSDDSFFGGFRLSF
jgi:outer membrane lipase/esterase